MLMDLNPCNFDIPLRWQEFIYWTIKQDKKQKQKQEREFVGYLPCLVTLRCRFTAHIHSHCCRFTLSLSVSLSLFQIQFIILNNMNDLLTVSSYL
jgi:hypothetical protein